MYVFNLEAKEIRRGTMSRVHQSVSSNVKDTLTQYVLGMVANDNSDKGELEIPMAEVEQKTEAIVNELMANNRRSLTIGIAELDWGIVAETVPTVWDVLREINEVNY